MALARTSDMTKGPIFKKMIAFVLPIMLGNLLQQIYHMADTFIVGQTLGVEKLGAVGAAGSSSFLVMGFIFGLVGGCAIPVSQNFGAGNMDALRRSIASALVIGGSIALILSAIFIPLTKPLLMLLNTPENILPYSVMYLRIIYIGTFSTMLYNIISSALRAVGNSKTPLVFLLIASTINVILDYMLIAVFKMDVDGAAIATVVSQLISGILCLIYVLKKHRYLIPKREDWKGIGKEVMQTAKVSVPMGFQMTFVSIGSLVLQSVLNSFGSLAVSAHTVGDQFLNLMRSPMNAVGTMVATFVGQNYGARQFERIKSGMRIATIFTVSIMMAEGLIVWLCRAPLITLYVDPSNTAVTELVNTYLNWMCPTLWMLGFVFVYRAGSQGLGDGLSTLIGGIAELIMRAGLPTLLAPYMGFAAVCTGNGGAWCSCGILLVIIYFVNYRKKLAAYKAELPAAETTA